MGRWYLTQLACGTGLEDAAMLDLQIQEQGGGLSGGLVVFQQSEMELYQRLVESARARLADLELDYGIEKSKVDSIRSKLFAALRPFYQERDRLRLLVQFRKAFIDRLLAEGEESAEATAGDYQREATEKDREYDSTASALEGKRELNDDEMVRLKQLWK
jgi:hypothetical protein